MPELTRQRHLWRLEARCQNLRRKGLRGLECRWIARQLRRWIACQLRNPLLARTICGQLRRVDVRGSKKYYEECLAYIDNHVAFDVSQYDSISRRSSVDIVPTPWRTTHDGERDYAERTGFTGDNGEGDTIMRSPSPPNDALLADRLSAAEKEKHRMQATPGPPQPQRLWDEFYDSPMSENLPFLGAHIQHANDSTVSTYPPIPDQFREDRPFQTPVAAPSTLLGTYQIFESTQAHRGPRISDTLMAEEFPRRFASPRVRQPPLPPSPYIEDGHPVDMDSQRRSSLKDFVDQLVEHVPSDMEDFLQFITLPTGGVPKLHFSTPMGTFENIINRQLLDWEKEIAAGLTALGISFYGCGALDGLVDPRYKQLLSFAAHLLNARFHTDRIAIAQPTPISPVTHLNQAPFTALVYGFTHAEAKTLREEGVMCTPRLAMFFHPLDISYPNYVGAIHGLSTRLIQPVYEMVLNHFLTPEAMRTFQELTSRPPNPVVCPEDAQTHFVNTLYVRRLNCRARGNTHSPVFLIYIDSPATDFHSHRIWTTFCKTINLSHSLYGTGVLRSPGVCAGCHGHDHPSGLCRYPQVPNWNAPPLSQPPNFSIPPPPNSASSSSSAPQQQNPRPSRGGFGDQRTNRRRRGNTTKYGSF